MPRGRPAARSAGTHRRPPFVSFSSGGGASTNSRLPMGPGSLGTPTSTFVLETRGLGPPALDPAPEGGSSVRLEIVTMAETDTNRVENARRRQIGAIGTTARVILGLARLQAANH